LRMPVGDTWGAKERFDRRQKSKAKKVSRPCGSSPRPRVASACAVTYTDHPTRQRAHDGLPESAGGADAMSSFGYKLCRNSDDERDRVKGSIGLSDDQLPRQVIRNTRRASCAPNRRSAAEWHYWRGVGPPPRPVARDLHPSAMLHAEEGSELARPRCDRRVQARYAGGSCRVPRKVAAHQHAPQVRV
jgi:hypothetical protein